MTSQVRLLGPIDVIRDGVTLPVTGMRRQAILAALGLRAGEVISADGLIEIVWDGRPPATAANTLQSHISYLRRELGLREIVARSPGYLLHLHGTAVDTHQAEELIQRSRSNADPHQSMALLQQALALWRGQPLVTLLHLRWFAEQAERLERTRRVAFVALADLRLVLGEYVALLPELTELAQRHPLDEEVHRQLILALHHSGRRVEAHEAYDRLRRRLGDELGIDPGPTLRELESIVLRPAAVSAPAQLPPATARFVARESELSRLDSLLRKSASGTVLAVICGAPGVGKTTLAIHWAHRASACFPDGQLYVNLRGFDPAGSAISPDEAVRGFLGSLGVSPQQTPPQADAQVSLYRSLLAGKRMLVLLDNARDAEQVRPLMPGSSRCVVLVTSRVQLSSLSVTEDATVLQLNTLTSDESRALLTDRLGPRRVTAERVAVDDIVRRTAGLPLALAILAARATIEPGLSLAKVAAEMDDGAGPLDALAGGDHATDTRAVFSWSYHALSPSAAELFRLLALHPGPDFTPEAAASLAGLPLYAIRPSLAELAAAHLLTQPAAERYSFHDLLHAYAVEQAQTLSNRHVATQRLLDHYLHTAHRAATLMSPYRPRIPIPPSLPGTATIHLDEGKDALAWFLDERHVLRALIEHAYANAYDTHAWRLAWTMMSFLMMRMQKEELKSTHWTALMAANRLADPIAQAHALRGIALADMASGRFTEGRARLEEALALFVRAGDRVEQARILLNLANVLDRGGQPGPALDHALQALRRCQDTDDLGTRGDALNAVGLYYARRGDYDDALRHCQESVRLLTQLGNRGGEAFARDSLAYVYQHLGEYPRAVEQFELAVELFGDLGDKRNEAATWERIGDCHTAFGHDTSAHRTWRRALDLFQELEQPDGTARVTAKLNVPGTATS